MWIRLTSLLCLTLTLNACNTLIDRDYFSISLPDFWQQPVPETADAPAPLAYDWWKGANDPTMNILIEQLDSQNLSLEQARFRLEAARVNKGGTDYLPTLGASAAAQFDHTLHGAQTPTFFDVNAAPEKTTSFSRISGNLAWEVPLFGQFGAARDITKAQTISAEADMAAIRNSVIAETVQYYAELRAAQARQEQLQNIQKSQQHILELTEIKKKVELASESDRLQAEQALHSINAEIAQAQNTIADRSQRLALLIGSTSLPESLSQPNSIPRFPVTSFSDTPRDVLRNRPDIRQAEQDVLIAARELDLSKAERYPHLNISGNITQSDNIHGQALFGSSLQLTGTPTLSLPLFDWGKRISAVKVRGFTLQEETSAYRETVLTAMNEVEQSIAAYNAAVTTRKADRTREKNAKTLADHASILKEQGLSDNIAVENARISHARSTIDRLTAQSNETSSFAVLTRALGGGIAAPEGATHAQ